MSKNESSQSRNLNISNYSTYISELNKEDKIVHDVASTFITENIDSVNFMPTENKSIFDTRLIKHDKFKTVSGINSFEVIAIRAEKDRKIPDINKDKLHNLTINDINENSMISNPNEILTTIAENINVSKKHSKEYHPVILEQSSTNFSIIR